MFDTLDGQGDWKIISVFKTNTLKEQGELFNYLMVDFANDKDFLDFVYDVKIRSIIDTPVDVGKNDRLITLSTCSYEMKDFRTVDVENAKLSGNPLMPSGYYSSHGGKSPEVNGFEKDLAAGKLSWYVEQ